MSALTFPIHFTSPCGQPFSVTADAVRADYAYTFRQFDDLTEQQQTQAIERASEDDLMTWFAEHWEWCELLSYSCRVGPWKHKAGKARFYREARKTGTRSPYDWLARGSCDD